MNKNFWKNIRKGTLLFDRFRAITCINSSATSGVYLCSDIEDDNSPVALKVISTENSVDSVTAQRFRNEMQVSYCIKHPNVLSCETFHEDDLFSAFTMPYVKKGTLGDSILQKDKFEVIEIVNILRQICEGLQAIHDAGILHRDLKPENILIDANGTVKIADFGIAVVGTTIIVEEDEGLFGTINYLSPEYVEHGRFDKRSDIYSIGLVAYELVTKRLAFQESSPLKKLTARVISDPQEPKELRTDCPQEINDIIMKALERDPEKRFQSAEEILLALEQIGSKKKTSWQVEESDETHEHATEEAVDNSVEYVL